jgi:recombination protein RecA
MAKKDEKEPTLEEYIATINKDLKLDSVQIAGSSKALDIPRLSSGSITYDVCVGGGFPIGRHTLLYGAESSGKSTVSLMALAQYQKTKDKRLALIVDSEYAVDKKYCESLGVDLKKVIIIQPDHLAQAHSVLMRLLQDNKIGFFIVDSIAALLPQSVIENEADASNIGVHAKAIGNMYKISNSHVGKNAVTAIWINQIRDAIGGYGGGISLPAGHAPKFYSSVMIKVMRGTKTDNKDGTFTNQGWIRVEKNKTAPPYMEGKYDMEHGSGISVAAEVRDYGLEVGVLYKKGHSYYHDPTFENDPEKSKEHITLGISKDEAKQFLKDNDEFRNEMYDLIIKAKFSK